MTEHWLISLIRQAQQNNPAIAGLITERDDGGPTRADAIYASLPQHAQGAFDGLGIDKQLLSHSSPEEIAAFAGDKLPGAPGAAPQPGLPTIFVSVSPRGDRHRTTSVNSRAFCGAVPEAPSWGFKFDTPSSLTSRNCSVCRKMDPNEGVYP